MTFKWKKLFMSLWNLNFGPLLFSLLYYEVFIEEILYISGTGLVIPYMPVLAKELGFSSVVVGIVYTCLPIIAMVAKPTMGALADRLHCQKGMFISFILLTMLSLFIIPWIPPIPSVTNVEVHCNADSDVKMCSDSLRQSDCYPDVLNRIGNGTVHCDVSKILY